MSEDNLLPDDGRQPGKMIYFISGLVVVCVLALMVMLVLEPYRNRPAPPVQGTLKALTATVEPRATPLPAELLDNQYLTNGIVLGASLMIILVVGVTLAVILRKDTRYPK